MTRQSDDKNLNQHILNNLSEFFRILSDTTRIRILYVLNEKEICVTELAKVLGNEQSLISHNLSRLRKAKLVNFKKRGRKKIYFISNPDAMEVICKVINLGGINYEKEI